MHYIGYIICPLRIQNICGPKRLFILNLFFFLMVLEKKEKKERSQSGSKGSRLRCEPRESQREMWLIGNVAITTLWWSPALSVSGQFRRSEWSRRRRRGWWNDFSHNVIGHTSSAFVWNEACWVRSPECSLKVGTKLEGYVWIRSWSYRGNCKVEKPLYFLSLAHHVCVL